MIASSVPKGDGEPKSTTNPVFFCVLFQLIVVPLFTQNVLFPFAPGISGVAEAPYSCASHPQHTLRVGSTGVAGVTQGLRVGFRANVLALLRERRKAAQ